MDSRDLEYVLTIARTGSFSQAAQQLFISQPALSQYIKRLEKDLNVTLFYRSRSRVELSAAGMFYVKQGESILKAMQELEQTMRHWQQKETRQLSIGVSQFYGKWFLTPYLQDIRQQLPGWQIRIVDGESHNLEIQMLQGKLDFGIFPAPVTHKDITFLPLGDEEILFAFSEENREAMDLLPCALTKGGIDLALYRHFPFVLPREGLKMHKAALKICRQSGFQPQSVYSSENLDTVYSLVNHNYGVGFLPDVLAKNYDPRTNHVRFFHLKSRYNHRAVGLACREGAPLQGLAPKLYQAIKNNREAAKA
ncbi:LysR family transcriptional regulator [Acidaminococcus sp.]|uniref:LysR family transcriptional regulator n=1 Tax=Acidaminococcus sp. TaxID=1872103 RepID=UPI003D7D31A5